MVKIEMKLVDNIEQKTYKGSKATITTLLYKKYKEYIKMGTLKGVLRVKDTWFLG